MGRGPRQVILGNLRISGEALSFYLNFILPRSLLPTYPEPRRGFGPMMKSFSLKSETWAHSFWWLPRADKIWVHTASGKQPLANRLGTIRQRAWGEDLPVSDEPESRLWRASTIISRATKHCEQTRLTYILRYQRQLLRNTCTYIPHPQI